MNRHAFTVTLLLSLAATAATANVGKIGQILQQQREIRDASEHSTGAYARFGAEALGRMHAAQDRIFELLDGVSAVEQLNRDQQAELFNALEEVKAVIADNQANKQVCWREHKLGTTLRQTRCATVAERAQAREESRQWHGDTSICGQASTGISCGTDAVGRLGP
ncbi:hypothetical protein ACFQZQ_11255 [Lysobacter koreensis]|uniref:Uncharacterized protein n=1 Tax=Lysobacter koreensis TaxID=266122 RepID=A0ABW2YN87_9GAMM